MERFLQLEKIAGQDMGGRGMQALIEFGELERICKDLSAAEVFPV